MKYAGRFELDLGGDFVYLDSLKNLRGVTIGSMDPDQFIPIAFCSSDIHTINLIRDVDDEFINEDLLELAEYAAHCNKEVEE